jgi:hypothetical protein
MYSHVKASALLHYRCTRYSMEHIYGSSTNSVTLAHRIEKNIGTNIKIAGRKSDLRENGTLRCSECLMAIFICKIGMTLRSKAQAQT